MYLLHKLDNYKKPS